MTCHKIIVLNSRTDKILFSHVFTDNDDLDYSFKCGAGEFEIFERDKIKSTVESIHFFHGKDLLFFRESH